MGKALKIFSCGTAFFWALVLTGINGRVYAEELTITVDNGASVELTPSVEGTFASTEDDGNASAKFSVTTDNYTGYDLSFTTGNSGEFATKLTNVVTKNGETTTYALNSIGAVIDGATFDSDNYNNTWGIKPSKYNSTINTNYLPVSSKMVLDNVKKSGTNEYTIAVGIRANYEYPAGEYTNTLILTAVANPTTYEVPVEFKEKAGISSVTFTQVGEKEPAAKVVKSGGKAALAYGTKYEVEVSLKEGFELEEIKAASGEFNKAANTYKIEITDGAPALVVTTTTTKTQE